MIRQFHRNESSWNVRSRGTKVPRERMFHRTKVLGTFAPEERKFHRSECSMERKFHGSESSLSGLFAPWNESAEERKGLESLHWRGLVICELRTGELVICELIVRTTDANLGYNANQKVRSFYAIKRGPYTCLGIMQYNDFHNNSKCRKKPT